MSRFLKNIFFEVMLGSSTLTVFLFLLLPAQAANVSYPAASNSFNNSFVDNGSVACILVRSCSMPFAAVSVARKVNSITCLISALNNSTKSIYVDAVSLGFRSAAGSEINTVPLPFTTITDPTSLGIAINVYVANLGYVFPPSSLAGTPIVNVNLNANSNQISMNCYATGMSN